MITSGHIMVKNTILYSVYKVLIKLLSIGNCFPTVLTSKEDLLLLIQMLCPVSTDKELFRMGSKGDGGYLIPNDIEGIEACFSPGVSNNSEFEKQCAELGMKVFLADYSVNGPAEPHNDFIFSKKFIGAANSEVFMTLSQWVEKSNIDPRTDLLLQMDIEGSEYETILNTPNELLDRFRIIVIEFHHLHQLWNRPFFRLIYPAFKKLLTNHTCLHIHPNNSAALCENKRLVIPNVMEFTFLRNDRFKKKKYARNYPHPLDSPNTGKRDIRLPQDWYCKTGD